MDTKIIAFGASNSKQSINQKLAVFTGSRLKGVTTEILDLNHYPLPIFSVDSERLKGIPEAAVQFYQKIKSSQGIIISLAEYNGLHTAVFKNLWDWLSRIKMEKPMSIWNSNPMFLLSTSPSKRSMSNVLKISKELFPYFGADIVASFHLPSFNHFFKDDKIVDPYYRQLFEIELQKFQENITQN
ncbi:NADPH-dependent FMN reductase [Ulvibacterium sp.]|uniref:NADPH-dependent FMN reductase n=1 Tax=Ulvibacterium sp. TaxID=2665914 RepID=UPI003CC5ED94